MTTTATTPNAEQLLLHSYSRGRRHPMMIGLRTVGLKVTLLASPTQILVFLATAVPLWLGWSLWAHLGGFLNAVVMVGVPLGAAFAARALKVEGRSPLRAAVGVLSLALSPATGRRGGRATPRRRAHRRRLTYYLDSPAAPETATPLPPELATAAAPPLPAPASTPASTPAPADPQSGKATVPERPRRALQTVSVSELAAAAAALQAGAFRADRQLAEAPR